MPNRCKSVVANAAAATATATIASNGTKIRRIYAIHAGTNSAAATGPNDAVLTGTAAEVGAPTTRRIAFAAGPSCYTRYFYPYFEFSASGATTLVTTATGGNSAFAEIDYEDL